MSAARAALRALRGAGAVLLWLTLESLFVTPRDAAGVAALQAGRPYEPLIPPALGALLNLAIAAGFVWWFALRPRVRRDPARRATFRLRAPAPGAWPRVALAAVAAAVGANALIVVLPRFFRAPSGSPLEAYARVPGGTAALLAVAVLVAPLLEEFFFRGWMQGALERRLRAAAPAVAATALVFAVAHMLQERPPWFGFVPRFALAAGAGYAAWRTRSVWPAVAMHATYNASLFVGGPLLDAALPAPPAMEAWADRDAAAAFFWAHDPRVFGGAVAVLFAGAAVATWALSRLPPGPRDAADAPPAGEPALGG